MRVLITGSREWRDYGTIRRRLAALPPGSTIVHGAATGADAMSHVAALALGHTPEPHWPDFENHAARTAPLKRNEHMVSLGADLCIAFPTPESRGTWHCYNLALAAGIAGEVIG